MVLAEEHASLVAQFVLLIRKLILLQLCIGQTNFIKKPLISNSLILRDPVESTMIKTSQNIHIGGNFKH